MSALMLQTRECSSAASTAHLPMVEPLAAALRDVLRQTAHVIEELSDEDYTAPVNGARSGSIGNHVRHCLDHVAALLSGLDCGEIDYDHRTRGTPVEGDRLRAAEKIHELRLALQRIAETALDQPVSVRAMASASGPVLAMSSSMGREFSFVLSHTIHHNAMIAAAAATRGLPMPANFGYAPSTIAYRTQLECVPSA